MKFYVHIYMGRITQRQSCINKEGNENRLSNVKPEKSLGIVYLDISDGQILFLLSNIKASKGDRNRMFFI